MLKPFICGTGSFDHELEEPCSSQPTSKKSRKIGSCKTKDNKNPYSNRGLEKFSALLVELEDKRQKIYSQTSPDEISFVRFTYTNSNEFRPIVIKAKQRKQDSKSDNIIIPNPVVIMDPSSPVVMDRKDQVLTKEEVKARVFSTSTTTDKDKDKEKRKKQSCSRSSSTTRVKKLGMQRPLNYLTAALILILVVLVLFGKSFAILCLSMGWYLVPAIKGDQRFEVLGNSKEVTRKKKEHTRRHSEKMKIVYDEGSSSPNSVLVGPMAGYATPRRQGPRKCL